MTISCESTTFVPFIRKVWVFYTFQFKNIDVRTNMSQYQFRREHNLLIPWVRNIDPTVGNPIKKAADVGMLHIFQANKRGRFSSQYDPETEKIQLGLDLKAWDKNGNKPYEVKSVLLLGSNYIMWGGEVPRIAAQDGPVLDAIIAVPTEKWKLTNPESVEQVAFAASLHTHNVFEKNGIASTIFYCPSDLPPHGVPDVTGVREETRQNKTINPVMLKIMEQYGFSKLPLASNEEITSDPSLQTMLSSGKYIWHAIESAFRRDAKKLLKTIVRDGIEAAVSKYSVGGTDAWKEKSRMMGHEWEVRSSGGVHYIEMRKRRGHPFSIPIGFEDRPKCALMISTMMMKANNYGFSHVLNFTDHHEAQIANKGFILARQLFGIPIYTYSVAIADSILDTLYCGRNGRTLRLMPPLLTE